MTNCSPGKSFDLNKTNRQGKTRTTTNRSKSKGKYITLNDTGSIRLPNERNKTVVRAQASNNIYDSKKKVCENEQICCSVEMKLSSLKTLNWLESLPVSNRVSSFVVVHFDSLQLFDIFSFQRENAQQ